MKSLSVVFLILTFLAARSASAQQGAAKLVLSKGSVESRLGAAWRGILFACDPYCRFLSINEDNKWSPQLTGEKIPVSALKAISTTDPLYPLLITTHPILPYVTKKSSPGETLSASTDLKEQPPKYALMSFDYGWSLDGGAALRSQSFSSNNVIQSDLVSQAPVQSFVGRVSVMKAKPQCVFGEWFQHRLTFLADLAGRFQTKDGEQGQFNAMEGAYQLWWAAPEFKTGPRLSWLNESYKVKSDSLTHFSTSWTGYFLGWALLYRRWEMVVDAAVGGSLEEGQSFRAAPFHQQWYRIGAEYCSRDLSLFDFSFGICGALSYSLDKQESALASNLLSDDKSETTRSTVLIKTSIRFGEDFFQ